MIKLKKIPTKPPENSLTKKKAKSELKKLQKKIFKLQNKFYANGKYGVLIVLQGMDTSGKDGIVRHVIRSMNPMGVHIKAFGVPTEEEKKHDFLWRIYRHFPQKSMIQVFNRSHYEDVVIPFIKKEISSSDFKHRFEVINVVEDHLEKNDIKILKFFLHISYEEQQQRIKERKTKDHKKWKYDESDEYSLKSWNENILQYDKVINHPQPVEWNIIPSDKRWYRNYMVAKTIKEYLEKLDIHYPGTQSQL